MVRSAKRAVVLDSCVWVAFLHKEDSQHTKACALMGTLNQVILVPEYVLLEVATVLMNKGYRTQAQTFVEQIIQSPGVFLPAGDLVRETATLFCARKDCRLSFVDTALVALGHLYDIVTFDRDLAKALVRSQL